MASAGKGLPGLSSRCPGLLLAWVRWGEPDAGQVTEQSKGCELPPPRAWTKVVSGSVHGNLHPSLERLQKNWGWRAAGRPLKISPEPPLTIGCKDKKPYPTTEIQECCLSSSGPLSLDPARVLCSCDVSLRSSDHH